MLAHACSKCDGPDEPQARRRAIIDYVLRHPGATQALMAEVFGLTRQTVAKHAYRAQRDGCLPARNWQKKRGTPCKPPETLSDWKPPLSWPIGAVPPSPMGHE